MKLIFIENSPKLSIHIRIYAETRKERILFNLNLDSRTDKVFRSTSRPRRKVSEKVIIFENALTPHVGCFNHEL